VKLFPSGAQIGVSEWAVGCDKNSSSVIVFLLAACIASEAQKARIRRRITLSV
jgi:hypothetical protein